MSPPVEPFTEPSSSKEEIFRATYLAQIEHGFTDLSIQHIADRVSLSKSTIYHHFDDKEQLLMEYGEAILDWYIEELLFQPAGDAVENLERTLDLVFLGETEAGLKLDDVRPPGLDCVYIGLRMQAARDPEMCEYFDSVDSMARERLASLIQQGIDDGTLEDADPERVAATLYVFLEGALLLRSTETNSEWLGMVREVIDSYLADLKAES